MRTLRPGLSGDDPLATIRLPQRSLSSQSLEDRGYVSYVFCWKIHTMVHIFVLYYTTPL